MEKKYPSDDNRVSSDVDGPVGRGTLHFSAVTLSTTATMSLAKGPHCSFVLLAEFDIDSGAQLTYQFPQPLGTDEG